MKPGCRRAIQEFRWQKGYIGWFNPQRGELQVADHIASLSGVGEIDLVAED